MKFHKRNLSAVEESKFYFGVHLLRGIFAFLVVCYHYKQFVMYTPLDFLSLKSFVPPNLIVSFSNKFGSYGVEFFWSISGFILAKKYFLVPISMSKFMTIRFCRLYPLHLFTLLLVAIIQLYTIIFFGHFNVYGNNSVGDFFLHLFMASNWIDNSRFGFNAPIWSVSIEILVYFLFILLVCIQRTLIMPVLVLLCTTFIRIVYPNSWLLAGIAFFFLGVVLSLLSSYQSTNNGICLILIFLAILFDLFSDVRIHLIWVLLILGSINLLEYFFYKIQLLKRLCYFFGNISYSLYLIHIPIQLLFLAIFETFSLDRKLIAETNLFFYFYILCCISLSIILFQKFEQPSRQFLIKKFLD